MPDGVSRRENSATIDSPDFGGDTGTSSDGPYKTAGVWTQTLGQNIGVGTTTDLLEIDHPNPSYAYDNWSQYDPINGNPPTYTPYAPPDSGLGSAYGISGDGNTVVGNYTREGTFGTFQGGRMPLAFDIGAGTATALSGETAAALNLNGDILSANIDGSVLVGYTNSGPQIPTVWVNGTMYQLTHPDASFLGGRAVAVSDDGTRVSGFQEAFDPDTGANTRTQVIWDYNSVTDDWDRTVLGRLNGETQGLSQAMGMTADGSVVVGWDWEADLLSGGQPAGAGDTGQGTFWSETTGLVNIEDFLGARGIDTSNFEIGSIQGISPDGTTLLAWGFYFGDELTNLTGMIIDISDTPLSPLANYNLLEELLKRFGGTSEYAGDTYTGDWNHDQLVTAEDLDILLRNWDPSLGSPPDVSIPEPGSLALLLGIGGLLASRRRRSHH